MGSNAKGVFGMGCNGMGSNSKRVLGMGCNGMGSNAKGVLGMVCKVLGSNGNGFSDRQGRQHAGDTNRRNKKAYLKENYKFPVSIPDGRNHTRCCYKRECTKIANE